MCCSYSLSRCFVFVYIFATQLFLVRMVSCTNLTNAYLHHKCLTNQKYYKPGSEYEKNLNFLIRLISPYHFPDGFRHTTYGADPNAVTLIFQCRGDSYGSKCRSCFAIAVAGLRRRCPRNKGATIWYDQCFLDVGTIDSSPREIDYEKTFSMHNPNNVNGDKELFKKKTNDFLYKLIVKANRPSPTSSEVIYYAAGEEMIGTKKLYAMVQCAKDMLFCEACLKWSIKELSKCCYGKQGARVLGTSCNLRYELYPFIRT